MLTSLYIHIPFCNHICTYCDFHKELALPHKKEAYIDALLIELKQYQKDYGSLTTIFIGGGTPSSLPLRLQERLLVAIKESINLENIQEFSIEANPDNISLDMAKLWKKYGINRVSMGVQTFDENALITLGRKHKNKDVTNAIAYLRQVGITNISIDLIFNLQDQSIKEVETDLKHFYQLDIPHISYYSLILEEKTILWNQVKRNEVTLNDEDVEADMYDYIMNSLKNHGYEHYEISNYAKNKAYSHHNMTYWRNLEYLGIGSGAHSLINERRYFNVSSVAKYIDAIKTKKDYQTSYTRNAFEEYCMTGLRMMQGISLQTIEEEFSISLLKKYPILQNYITSGLLQLQGDYLSLTPKGILLGNEIFQLFLEEESC